jgi:hypothetical protein
MQHVEEKTVAGQPSTVMVIEFPGATKPWILSLGRMSKLPI